MRVAGQRLLSPAKESSVLDEEPIIIRRFQILLEHILNLHKLRQGTATEAVLQIDQRMGHYGDHSVLSRTEGKEWATGTQPSDARWEVFQASR